MPHRSHEWPGTLAQLRLAFANPAFQVHAPVPAPFGDEGAANHMRLRSEEHTSELQSLMRISYAVFCLKKKKYKQTPVPTDPRIHNTHYIGPTNTSNTDTHNSIICCSDRTDKNHKN